VIWGITVTSNSLARPTPVDQRLAEQLPDRYVDRLIRLAQNRLTRKVARRVDPEDVVQSALRSFFRRAQNGQYQWRGEREIWHLLVKITVRKVTTNERRHRAQRRSVDAEQTGEYGRGFFQTVDQLLSREPDPAAASAALEELGQILSKLPPLYRQIIEQRLQGHPVEQVSATLGCSERTVFRATKRCRELLEKRFDAGDD